MARVAILGAGRMGAPIGAEYALAGHTVTLVSRSRASADAARERAVAALRFLERERLARDVGAAIERIAVATEIADAELVVESLPESLALKSTVLRDVAARLPRAIVASNTSSIPIGAIGEGCGAPERTIGTHYMNPPTLMPLVEVIPGRATAPEVTTRVVAWLRDIGKEPIVVRDVPGFLWNRLQFALLREAARLVADGVADAATVDLAMRHGLGRRWHLVGPFESMALGGRDTFVSIARLLFAELERHVDPGALAAVALPETSDRVAARDAALASLRRADLGRTRGGADLGDLAR